jgi:adenylate cyclase
LAAGERRLAAIMFTDIVGYTHLSQADEALALELLQQHQVMLRPAFLAHGGTEVKTIGDAFLVEFKSALDAVTCGVEIQKKMREHNADAAPAKRLQLRIGVHVGDVVHDQGDIFGDAVNVASRVEPLADPGGVCISQQVYDQIRNKTPFEFEKVGNVRLRNVELPLVVYRVKMPGGASADSLTRPSKERIGVLPFVNISPDPNDEYFADGLTEELITKLSEVNGLKVIARTSAMTYKRTDKKVSEIGAELGVGSIVEGSVRKAGNKVRITVQLVDVGSEEHIWSSNYNGDLTDIFAIQSDVASKVAQALTTALFSAPRRKDTHSVEAYTMYLRAMQLSYETTEESIRETISLLERAVSKDPKFARAYAALADEWHVLAVSGYEDFTEMSKRAEASAQKALELDPGLPEAHSAMSGVHSMLDRFDAAMMEAEEAVRLNPNLSEGFLSLGTMRAIRGSAPEALEMFERAYELDPLSPAAGEMLATMAAWNGDDSLAWEVLSRTRDFNPKDPKVYLVIADYHMEKGEFEKAQQAIDIARGLAPDDFTIAVSQGLLAAFSGKRKEAEEVLRKVGENRTESARLFGQLAIQAALGDDDAAFETLMRQAEMHSWPYAIGIDPLFAKMRKDPRYAEFCRKVGIKPEAA